MVPLGFEPRENPLPILVSISALSPWPIKVPNPIKMKESFALILEGLKSKCLFQLLKIDFAHNFSDFED